MMFMKNNFVSMSARKLIGRRVVVKNGAASFTRIREFLTISTTTTAASNTHRHHHEYYDCHSFTHPNRPGALIIGRPQAIRDFSAVTTMDEEDDGPAPQYRQEEEEVGFEKYYRIEASNAERQDATKLTVHGPDVDGILASMTFALAVDKGCSLVELYASSTASTRNKDKDIENVNGDDDPQDWIHDVFWVVDRDTGRQIPDAELQDLARCLLEAAHSPVMSKSGMDNQKKKQQLQAPIPEKQITIIPSSSGSIPPL